MRTRMAGLDERDERMILLKRSVAWINRKCGKRIRLSCSFKVQECECPWTSRSRCLETPCPDISPSNYLLNAVEVRKHFLGMGVVDLFARRLLRRLGQSEGPCNLFLVVASGSDAEDTPRQIRPSEKFRRLHSCHLAMLAIRLEGAMRVPRASEDSTTYPGAT